MTTILVTGGTGTLGRHVAERLRTDGHGVRVLSRHARPYGVDLRAGGPELDRRSRGCRRWCTVRAVPGAGTRRRPSA